MRKNNLLKAAVLGHPISHSKSPMLHEFWLERYGIEGRYEALDTPVEQLEDTLKELAEQGYSGVNLTKPLKEVALPLLQEIDPWAQAIGAVNTVSFSAEGMKGYNTDCYGFIENVRRSVGGEAGFKHYLPHAVVLGAGGASRAVVAGLLQAGVKKITLCNRSRDKAEALLQELAALGDAVCEVGSWKDRDILLKDATLLVNTTPLGMQGQPELELSLDLLPVHCVVTDVVYQPLQTALLRNALRRGNKVVDGLGMLLYQAQVAFEIFFDFNPEVDVLLREKLLAA